jgi:hypothetical protein
MRNQTLLMPGALIFLACLILTGCNSASPPPPQGAELSDQPAGGRNVGGTGDSGFDSDGFMRGFNGAPNP